MTRRIIPKASASIFSYQTWADTLARNPTLLDRLNDMIDFESFRSLLDAGLPQVDYSKGGRPGYDSVLMFRILILQRIHGQLSDEQTEFQIKDRFSFQRFLALTVADSMPDANTIRNYREYWSKSGTIDACFALYAEQLEACGLLVDPGKIVDATFVDVPKQRNNEDENAHIKEHGTAPDAWSEQPAKVAQKDVDARWAKKGDEVHFGYKCHTLVASLSKLIAGFTVTSANVHDSQVFTELLDPERDEWVHADSAYQSERIESELAEMGIMGFISAKGRRNAPLTAKEQASNTLLSRIRSRVEHVFGDMTNGMKAMHIRCIGIVRAAGIIGLNNIAYNMRRAEQIQRLELMPVE